MPSHAVAEFHGTNRFEIVRRIGMGGMGVVYEAIDRERGERLALKTLRRMTPETLLGFKKEFRALQDLEHPNLISLGELIADEAQWFFTMELVDGGSFIDHVRPAPTLSPEEEVRAAAPTMELPPSGVDPKASASTRSPFQRGGEGALDEGRLREALVQLTRGLIALHAAGKVHRDIKPSNVLVDSHGRVVVLDFGLAIDHDRSEQLDPDDREIVGTVDYMSPEQAAAQPIGPPSDWYAVGVMLHEALTGDVPFSGDLIQVLAQKQRGEPPAPSRRAPGIPADLEELCVELLRFNPSERPTGNDILARLGVRTRRDASLPPPSFTGASKTFVGRRRELDHLRRAFEATRGGAAALVLLFGESGVGKTALVRRFTRALGSTPPAPLVLTGRCFERESVPYKAFDGIIDALSRQLVRLPAQEVSALLPPDPALLAEVFPVLSRVEAVAEAPRPRDRARDPLELRARVFQALRHLLAQLCARGPVVLVIDDLQWADDESAQLLGELVRPPSAPPLLVIATARRESETPAISQVRASLGEIQQLELDRLSPEEARDLARHLIESLGSYSLDPDLLVEEAGGHPLLIDEMVRYSAGNEGGPTRVTLEDALWSRVSELEDDTRRLLELVALAAGPLPQRTAARAAEMGPEFSRRIGQLRVGHLVRTNGSRESDWVETYHDRVRAAVLSHLSPDTTRGHHRRLAVALETSGTGDAEALAVHWDQAGVPAKAARYAILAAENAERSLAFERAARLYGMTLQLRPDEEPAERRRIQVKIGEALANAGRGAEAARAFLDASDGGGRAEALELRRRASEQLLRAGHINEGLRVTAQVLEAVGLSLAPTPARALASTLLQRTQLRLRGLRYQPREEREISPTELMRIDACWSVGIGLGIVDHIRGADFQTRNLILSLRAGDPRRIARALALEVMYSAASGSAARRRTAQLIEAARELCSRSGQPHLVGLAKMAEGVAAFLEGRFRSASSACGDAEVIFRDQCSGVAWELALSQSFRLWSQYYLGGLGSIAEETPRLVEAAQRRGDLYALTNLRTEFVHLAELSRDRPDAARGEIKAAIGAWSNEGFHLEHFWELHSASQVDLYAGDEGNAYLRVREAWPAMERALMLRIQQVRIESRYLRGRSALAAARRLGPARRRDAERMIASGLEDATALRKERVAWATPLSDLLGASAACLHELIAPAKGRPDPLGAGARLDPSSPVASAARLQLEEASRGFVSCDMRLHAEAARHRLGQLLGGEQGAAQIEQAEAWVRAEGVVSPERMFAMVAPPVTI